MEETRTPITLQTYNNDIINLLKENFTSEEQQLFIQNFRMYLEYGEDDTKFPIDFDIVWKWSGFTQKIHAKQLLIKYFKENDNFIIQKNRSRGTDSGFLTPEQSNKINGVQNKETIMLNVSTFKKFCLKSSTKKADEIHDYYIKMESILNKYFKENYY